MNAEERAKRLARLTNGALNQSLPTDTQSTLPASRSSLKRKRSSEANIIEHVMNSKLDYEVIDLTTDSDSERTTDGEKEDTDLGPVSTKTTARLPVSLQETVSSKFSARVAPVSPKPADPTLRFDKGQVLLTTAPNRPLPGHISIDEIFQRRSLKTAVLSSFSTDTAWLASKLDIGRTEVVLCMHAHEQEHDRHLMDCRRLPKFSLVFPSLKGGISCMHSKLQLLFYDTYLRIAVPTANLVSFDWGEELSEYGPGYLDNNVFVLDLPFRQVHHSGELLKTFEKRGHVTSKSLHHTVKVHHDIPFLLNLILYVLRAGYPDRILTQLLSHDFSGARGFDFVATIGGYHYGEAIHDSGRLALARAVKRAEYPTVQQPRITALASSLGSLDWRFVNTLAQAMMGQSLSGKEAVSPHSIDQIAATFRIAFPTMQAVHQASAGAGVIFFARKCIGEKKAKKQQSDHFPEPCLYEYHPKKAGVLSHTKAIVCEDLDRPGQGLAYLGSANLSASAWGDKVTLDTKTKQEKIFHRNWETGVLLPANMVTQRIPIDLSRPFKVNKDPWATPSRQW
ncbi:tyrosyl-DNA phosphodiesterase-domain-containing protein [Protomyces lactucae-debilis]|uniref:Tyrosyl-DNA phosphodiesterase-domain-containing protein n=1 Tax=Protomyces lactucae-debilis TaxID=2754530 RepID=A0A1Y2FP45_PROLT|nr:tyrosyl-DNA phosphodiesterase-domain-containing protein [Protomyces lactucae-debilis]ORY85104.1 tyrosyl-DNA phosphodiesterase-domain-containing protein [Protomyces lactucae-debilis]